MDHEEQTTQYSESSPETTDTRTSGPILSNNVTSGIDLSQTTSDQARQEQRQLNQYSTATSPLDMSTMSAALPEYAYRQMTSNMYQQPYPTHVQHAPMGYVHQNPQYTGPIQGTYPASYATHMHPQAFQQPRTSAHYIMNPSLASGQQMYHAQPYYIQQSPVSPSMQAPYPPTSQPQSYGHNHAAMYGSRNVSQYYGSQIRIDNYAQPNLANQSYDSGYYQGDSTGVRRTSSATSLNVSSALRGPPRKPKQSGHALWVGNLPPGTNILDLKDHFSKEATEDIESVFLISKSNCAFVNYKSEISCTAAMTRFHDSRFNSVRLVCRLRRGSSPASTAAPGGVTVGTSGDSRGASTPPSTQTSQQAARQDGNEAAAQVVAKVPEKYFIIKSLTIEDLERSVHNGIWATQSHNEELLNTAYQTAENVYLIFSANKSGEYFGYARMDTSIDDESASTIDSPMLETKVSQPTLGPTIAEIPLTIPTPATNTAPKGYVIDDSARGTIFWEAESAGLQTETVGSGASPDEADSGDDTSEIPQQSFAGPGSASPNATFGKPFKISWMSIERLPFYRTRGLRNPWNTNREVKIARDGTELEPNVGRKLVSMFHMGLETGRQQQDQFPGMIASMPGHSPAYRPF